ncbi:MAG: hypothetical protein MUF05_04710 [Candidatus Omnitrophica bacterium]|jgi:nitrogen regulatory protein PII|nr:hypothetical protein [Candidatus Omnitrophota bacterium]
MDKMIMIIYNEAIDIEVMEVLEKCAVKSYTKVPGVFGAGEKSGIHLGDDIWPGRNNLLFAAVNAIQSAKVLEEIRKLRISLAHEGVKAFVMPIESFT